MSVAAPPPAPAIDVLRAHWRIALTAADAALDAAAHDLGGEELAERRQELTAERNEVAQLLQVLARDAGALAFARHGIVSSHDARRALGLPREVAACVFDLEGVIVGSAPVHAAAWRQTLDEFLERRADQVHGSFEEFGQFAPFDVHREYLAHLHGRTRVAGVREFLASRGIKLPDGDPSDPPGAETVHGLAKRKREVLLRLLDTRRIEAHDGAHLYLELLRDAAIPSAVVSASAHTEEVLDRAGLTTFIDAAVGAEAIAIEHLQPMPEPDLVLAACRRLDVEPGRVALFETSPDGIAAGRAAGCRLVYGIYGVEEPSHGEELLAGGAVAVASDLAELVSVAEPA